MSDTGSGGGVTNDGGDDNSGPPQLVTIVSVDSSLSSSQVRPSLIKSASTPGKVSRWLAFSLIVIFWCIYSPIMYASVRSWIELRGYNEGF